MAVYFVSAPADWTSYRPVLELFVVVLFLLSSQRNRGCLRRGIFNSVLDLCPQQQAGVSVTSPSRFVCLRQPGWSFVVGCRCLSCVCCSVRIDERTLYLPFRRCGSKTDFLLSNYGFSAVMLYRKFVTAVLSSNENLDFFKYFYSSSQRSTKSVWGAAPHFFIAYFFLHYYFFMFYISK